MCTYHNRFQNIHTPAFTYVTNFPFTIGHIAFVDLCSLLLNSTHAHSSLTQEAHSLLYISHQSLPALSLPHTHIRHLLTHTHALPLKNERRKHSLRLTDLRASEHALTSRLIVHHSHHAVNSYAALQPLEVPAVCQLVVEQEEVVLHRACGTPDGDRTFEHEDTTGQGEHGVLGDR